MSARPGSERWTLPPVDAPPAPVKGMDLWVQTGDHWLIGARYTVSRVNGRSFYVSSRGRKQRHPLDRWRAWLLARDAEGFVVLDGHPMRPPGPAPLARAALASGGTGGRAAGVLTFADRAATYDGGDRDDDAPVASGWRARMDAGGRDARIFRAVRDVLRTYTLDEQPGPPEAARRFRVRRRDSDYLVSVDPAWREGPRCTCPDAARVGTPEDGAFCKHVVAVLLSRDDLRHQLVDLLL